jgi:cytochrome c oxidase subunit 4
MAHITPVKVYVGVFLLLMAMTAITVAVAYLHLGFFNKVVAVGIATFKATMVILYFMHVKYSSRLTKLVIASGVFFLILLLGLTMTDYASRGWLPMPATLQ